MSISSAARPLRLVADNGAVPAPCNSRVAFATADAVRIYMLAGKATLTLLSQRTGQHYTYRVSASQDGQVSFVSILTDSDKYQYIGIIPGYSLAFRTTAKSRLPENSAPVAGFLYFLRAIEAGTMPGNMTVYHEGSCGRCGRTLTHPESIERGIGPECAQIMGLE
jgi:uncharacterized metal-binding protein YceD (DUF177 family)